MKITYLMTDIGYSGGYMVIYDFLQGIHSRGIKCEIATPGERIEINEESLRKIHEGASKPLEKRPFHKRVIGKIQRTIRPKDEIDRIQELCSGIISNVSPDSEIVVATAWKTAFAAYSLSSTKIPVYHMQHYEELFCTEDETQRMLARSTYALPLNLMSSSTWLKGQLKYRFNKDAYLVNSPIDLKVFNSDGYDWREKFKKMDKLRIVAYSDSRKFKALPDLAEIMRITKSRLKDRIEWILFGHHNPGDLGCEYTFAGKIFKQDLRELYRSCHIVVMPSWYECFPLPPLESMACGSLSMCTRYGTEDYAFNNKNSLVFQPRGVQSIAQAIEDVAAGKYPVMDLVEEGLKTADNFSIQKRMDVYEEVIKEIAKNNVSEKFRDLDDLIVGKIQEAVI